VRVNATDTSGNEGNDESDNNFTIDSTDPVFTSVVVTDADEYYKEGDTITIYATLGETGLTVTADLSVLDSTFNSTAAFVDMGNNTYNYTTPALASGTMADSNNINVTVTATDTAANSVTDSTLDLTIDKTAINVTVTATDTAANSVTDSTLDLTIDKTAPALISDLAATDRPNDNGRTVTLSWGAPTEEGSGIDYYDIYVERYPITDVTSLTPVNASVSASAISFNVTTYGGEKNLLVDGESYYFAVVAIDNAGNENKIVTDAGPTVSYADYTITLDEGWNLISTPFIPTNSAIATVLSDILDDMVIVWYYNTDGSWESYDGTGGGADTLTTIEDGKGYWINMNDSVSLTFTGKFQSTANSLPKNYSIESGWNLIGARVYNDTITRAQYLIIRSGSGDDLEPDAQMWSFDANNARIYTYIESDNTLTRGFGYWLNSPVAGTYTAR